MNTYVKNGNLDSSSIKLYIQFKQHFSPLLLAKMAKFIHKLKLNPSSSLFFSKVKFYDVQRIQRENNLIIQQNQKNKSLGQHVYLNEITQNNISNIQKINQKQKSNSFLHKQVAKNKNIKKFSFDDFQKLSKYIEIMMRRFSDFEEFISFLKSANMKITQQLKCRQLMLHQIQKAKQRISMFSNFNTSPNNIQSNQLASPTNRPTTKQYYRLSMDRKRPYSTQRLYNKYSDNKHLFKKKPQNIRFQTQIYQNKNSYNGNDKNNSLKNMNDKKQNKLNIIQINQNIQKINLKKQNRLKHNKQTYLRQAKSQKNLKTNFEEFEWQDIHHNMSYNELQDRVKSKFCVEAANCFNLDAANHFRYNKNQIFNDSKGNNQKNNSNPLGRDSLKENKINQEKSRSSLLSSSSYGKVKNSNSKIFDFVIEQQSKNDGSKQKEKKQQKYQVTKTDKLAQKSNLFLQQNDQTQKKTFFNAPNFVNRRKKNMNRKIGQISDSQDSSVSTSTNLKDKSKKNVNQRRKGQKIDNDLQITFKRLVLDNTVKNLIQSQQMKKIQKQNKQKIHQQKDKLKNTNNINRLTSINSIKDYESMESLPFQRNILPQSQYLSTNCYSVSEQDIKRIQTLLRPIDRYNQSKMILKYGGHKGTEGSQFRYNKIGHLQFNHEYLLRFNSLQIDMQKQKTFKRLKKLNLEDLRIQISKAFIKKTQEQEAPAQKSLQIYKQYIQ